MKRLLSIAAVGLGCTGDPAYLGRLEGGGDTPRAELPLWPCGHGCFVDPGLPASTPALFAAEPRSLSELRIAYPLGESLHPKNLPRMRVQWRRTSPKQDVFRIRVTAPVGAARVHYDYFVPCLALGDQGECGYELEDRSCPACEGGTARLWSALAEAHAGQTVELSVAAYDPSTSVVAVSEVLPIRLSGDPVLGGLYYWSWSPPVQGSTVRTEGTIYRLPFGARKAQAFIKPRTRANPGVCGGCHSISRDGHRIAWSNVSSPAALDPPYSPSYLQIADTAATDPEPRLPMASQPEGGMVALGPDGAMVAVGAGHRVTILNSEDGAEVASSDEALDDAARGIYHPEFSPSGRELAVTIAERAAHDYAVSGGDIAILPFDGARFGAARIIAKGDTTRSFFYPSFSPDGNWLVFVAAPPGAPIYDQSQTTLMVAAADGGSLYALNRATVATGLGSTWPKFTPFAQGSGRLFFFTFNTKADYGYVLRNAEFPSFADRYPQLWLAAVDVSTLQPGADPSTAPVWLPFQEVNQHNHTGLWSTSIRCNEDADCGDVGLTCGRGPTGTDKECLPPVVR